MTKKKTLPLIVLGITVCFLLFTGCRTTIQPQEIPSSSFIGSEPQKHVQYQMVINRTTIVDLENESGQSSPQTMSEKLTTEFTLQPSNTNQNLITFKGICNSVHIYRTDFVGTQTSGEVLRNLQGKEFKLVFSEDGILQDASSLKKLMESEVNIYMKTCKGSFKEPDMLTDFYNVVVDLCAASAKDQYSQGENIIRYELTPTPAIEFSLPSRKIASRVQQITNTEGHNKARIFEIHTMTENTQAQPLNIYPNPIKTGGLFSSLRRWQVQSINGTGEKVINLDAGVCELLNQHWQVHATAGFSIPIRDTHPVISIDETISVKASKIFRK